MTATYGIGGASAAVRSDPSDDIAEMLSALEDRLVDVAGIRECVACQQLLAVVLELIHAHVSPTPLPQAPVATVRLTERERDVLGCLADGLTAQQIARRLRISVATVRKHLEHAYAKLGVHDRLAATIRMRELELLCRPTDSTGDPVRRRERSGPLARGSRTGTGQGSSPHREARVSAGGRTG